MPVSFDLGSGTTTTVQNNQHLMQTYRGLVPADEVVQGDSICVIRGHPLAEVVSPPTVT